MAAVCGFVDFRRARALPAIGLIQGCGDGPGHHAVDLPLTGKPHLVLGGVYIDVHLIGRHADVADRHRKLAFHQALAIALHDRMQEGAGFHVAAVDEEVDPREVLRLTRG